MKGALSEQLFRMTLGHHVSLSTSLSKSCVHIQELQRRTMDKIMRKRMEEVIYKASLKVQIIFASSKEQLS